MQTRRQFFKLLAGGIVAPVVARALPSDVPKLWSDGIHDDAPALDAFFRGEPIEFAPGVEKVVTWANNRVRISGGNFYLSKLVDLPKALDSFLIEDCHITMEWQGEPLTGSLYRNDEFSTWRSGGICKDYESEGGVIGTFTAKQDAPDR